MLIPIIWGLISMILSLIINHYLGLIPQLTFLGGMIFVLLIILLA